MPNILDTDKEARKNCYYLSISAVQKCVRFGYYKEAVRFAKIAHDIEPFRFYQRFHTILIEESSFDPALIETFQKTPFISKDTNKILYFVREMAQGIKVDNSTCATSLFVTDGKYKVNEEIESWLFHHNIEELISLKNEWEDSKYNWYGPYDELEWLVCACERSHKFDYEQLGSSIPLLYKKLEYSSATDCTLVNDIPHDDIVMLDDWFPGASMDAHTRPGIMAIKILFKKLRDSAPLPPDYDGQIVFQYEGGLKNNKISLPIDDFKKAFQRNHYSSKPGENLFSDEVKEFYTDKIKPELNNLRRWVIDKKMKEVFEGFKQKYEEAAESKEVNEIIDARPVPLWRSND